MSGGLQDQGERYNKSKTGGRLRIFLLTERSNWGKHFSGILEAIFPFLPLPSGGLQTLNVNITYLYHVSSCFVIKISPISSTDKVGDPS